MKILTVSVAAYNMEKYLRQNLDSFVCSPVAEDVEVLVINDGSSDGTASIAAEYQARFPGIVRRIDQENAGPGSTVNRGMEHASGKYFRMVDADDWVGEGFADFVRALKTQDADLVLSDYATVDESTGRQTDCPVAGIAPGKVTDFADVSGKLNLSMHNVTWRTSILREHAVRLFPGFYTDTQYLLFPMPFVKTVLYVNRTVYLYRVGLAGQSMAIKSLQRNFSMHDAMFFSLVELYRRTEGENPAAELILRHTAYLAGTQLHILLSFPPTAENKKALFGFFEKLHNASDAVFSAFCILPTVRLLRLCGGVLYRPLCLWHRKRLGLKE